MFDCVRGYIRLGQDFVPAGQPQGWLYGWLGLNPRIYTVPCQVRSAHRSQLRQKEGSHQKGWFQTERAARAFLKQECLCSTFGMKPFFLKKPTFLVPLAYSRFIWDSAHSTRTQHTEHEAVPLAQAMGNPFTQCLQLLTICRRCRTAAWRTSAPRQLLCGSRIHHGKHQPARPLHSQAQNVFCWSHLDCLRIPVCSTRGHIQPTM